MRMYELIYLVDGQKRKNYPQTETHAKKLIGEIMQNEPVYKLVSCEKCNHYDAYCRGSDMYGDFLLEQSGETNFTYFTDEQEEKAVEEVLEAPFEYDKDLAYFILCENASFKEANEFYREVTA